LDYQSINQFVEWCIKQTSPLVKEPIESVKKELSNVEGLYEYADGFNDNVKRRKKEIEVDIQDNVLAFDENIQKIDLALEKIMKPDSRFNINSQFRFSRSMDHLSICDKISCDKGKVSVKAWKVFGFSLPDAFANDIGR
jgi:hypothetical protein